MASTPSRTNSSTTSSASWSAHEAVRTCVLARRWRHLWRHSSAVRVVAKTGAFLGSMEKALEFLEYLLPLREGSPPHMLELMLIFCEMGSEEGYDDYEMREVDAWFWHAITHKVRDLRLRSDFDCGHYLELDDMPVNSQHLTRLELAGVEVYGSFLNFSNCPVLEYLQLEESSLAYDISSESLKLLIITDCTIKSFIYICTPNLVSLRISGNREDPLLLESMPSLVEAFIDQHIPLYPYLCTCCQCEFCDNTYVIGDSTGSDNGMLLQGLSEATNLTLKSDLRSIIFKMDLRWCPMFSKLKTLLLDDYWCVPDDFRALVCLLEHSPVIEKLTLELSSKTPRSEMSIKGDFRPMERSAAISEHLKLIEIKCKVVDERIFKLMLFLCAFHIRLSLSPRVDV